jgi:hypothetical protein
MNSNHHTETAVTVRGSLFFKAILMLAMLLPLAAMAAPGVPVPASPTNGALNQPLALALSWGSVASAASYGVQVSTSSSFGTTVFGQTGITTASATVSGLTINMIYYWSVNASNGSGTSLWATAASFTTIASKLAPVNLGTAGNFVILAKSGISATGTTSVVGNIGVSPIAATAITGFGLIMDPSGVFSTSSLVDGKVYAANYTTPTPTNLTTAVSNMQTAYTDAAGRPTPDYTDLYSGDLTGHTLAPGLYKWSTGVQVDGGGAVTISGSASSIWIFQIAQNLNLANGAMVTLTGGAQASNIFWQVAGQVTLGTTTAMKGIILCQTAVVMNAAAAMNGKVFSQTAVTLIGDPVVSSDSSSAAAPAAPTLVSPSNSAKFTNGQPLTATWAAAATAIFYTIQVATSSGFGSTTLSQSGITAVSYQLTPTSGIVNYWRVSATNAGGTSAWSSAWTLTPSVTGVLPSLLSNDTYKFSMKQGAIAYSLPKAEQVVISLYDILGRTSMTLNRRQAVGSYSFNLKNSTLAAGSYIVRFSAGTFEKQAIIMVTR